MISTQEKWNAVVGWEGLYEVSNFGNIKSLDREIKTRRGTIEYTKKHKGSMLTPQKDKDGYLVIHLRDSENSRNRLLKVHRLVAEAFIPNPNQYDCIDHINGVRSDNRVENLRWCTNSQNVNFPLAKENRIKATTESYNRHPWLRALRAKTFGRSGLQPIIVFKDGVKVGEFAAIVDFCKQYQLNYSYFYNGIRKNGIYKGYTIERIKK